VERTVDADVYRSVFRRHAAGVVVITADAGHGPVGFTATSLVSISLLPPLVSFAIATSASSWPAVSTASSVVINFLSADQHAIAGRFATSGIDRFAAPTRWRRLPTGEPVLDGAARWLRASVRELVPVGDHALAVLLIEQIELGAHPHGLVYHDGGFAAVHGRG